MKALRVHTLTSPAPWQLDDIPRGDPGPGEVRVRIVAAGISLVDQLRAEGKYQIKPALPYIGGSEYAGIVEAVGSGVPDSLRVGDRVAGLHHGVWAESVCMPYQACHRLGTVDDAMLVESALVAMPYATALYALDLRGNLKAGETVFVLGAIGGVGHAALQTAKALGARVIAAASTAARREAALQDGADAVVDTSVADWKDALKAAAGPGGVDIVVDPVGGAATEMAFRALGWGGRLLVIGFAAGAIGKLPANLALLKGAAMVGVDLRAFGEREPEAMQAVRERVFALHASGRVRPRIGVQVPVQDYARAFAATRDSATLGRVVLRFG